MIPDGGNSKPLDPVASLGELSVPPPPGFLAGFRNGLRRLLGLQPREVFLTDGSQIRVTADPHPCHAVLARVMERELARGGWNGVREHATRELYYVAGQLRAHHRETQLAQLTQVTEKFWFLYDQMRKERAPATRDEVVRL